MTGETAPHIALPLASFPLTVILAAIKLSFVSEVVALVTAPLVDRASE